MRPPRAPGQPGINSPDGEIWSRLFLGRVFRERALQRRARQEPLDDPLQITAPHEWLIAAGLCLVVLSLAAFAVFGRVDRTMSLEAALVLPGERHYLVAPVSGTVQDVLLGMGDAVTANQPVALIRPFDADHWAPAIVGVIAGLEQNGQLDEATRVELLQSLPAAPVDSASAPIELPSQFAGELVALTLAPGQVVDAGAPVGLVRASSSGRPEVLAFVTPGDAAVLGVGMEARVNIVNPQTGDGRVLKGLVAELSARSGPPPAWLADRGIPVPHQARLLRIELVGDESDEVLIDGPVNSLQILLGRESLLSFLAPGSGE